MMKWIIRLVLLVIVVTVGVAVGGYFYIDAIAQQAVERGGSYAMGVPTTVQSVRVKPMAGEVALKELRVDNPQGFERQHFFTLGSGEAAVKLSSLMGEQVTIPRIHLDGVMINLEKNKDGTANYQKIMENLQKVSGSPDEQPEQQKAGKRYVIKDLRITDIKVRTDIPLVSVAMKQPIEIADIHLQDVGSDTDNGVLMSQLTGIIMQSVLKAVATQLTDVLPGTVIGGLETGLGGIGDIGGKTVGELGGAVTKSAEDLTKGAGDVGEGAGKIVEGVGGLLGGKKKQDTANTQEQNNE